MKDESLENTLGLEDRCAELEEVIRTALYGRVMDECGNRSEGGLLSSPLYDSIIIDLLGAGVDRYPEDSL